MPRIMGKQKASNKRANGHANARYSRQIPTALHVL